MNQILLYQVDPVTVDLLQRADNHGSRFHTVSGPEEVLAALSDGSRVTEVLIVGTFVSDPITIAQQAHGVSRKTAVILLAEITQLEQLTKALQFSPLIGVHTVCVAVEDHQKVLEVYRQTTNAVRKRRSHQTLLAAAEAQLKIPPAPVTQGAYVEHLLRHAPIGVVALDTDGRVLAWNSFATKATGVMERTALGVKFPTLFPEPWKSEIEAHLSLAFKNDQGSFPPLVVDSGTTAIEITMSLLQEGANSSRLILLIRDITSQLRAERMAAEATRLLESANLELREARDQAVEASRAKTTFLANMSHELRTPLNAIIGYSEMLQEQALAEQRGELAEDLGRIYAAGRHLLMLIGEILDISKIEAGKMDLYVSRFAVDEVIAEVTETIQPLMEKNRNRLEVECDATLGHMQSDETKVRQIMFNLLSNAAKFTEDGLIKLSATLERGNDGDAVLLRVSDTGIGMSEKQLSSLFREFSQVDPSSTRRHGGTGLGLAISRRFSQMMGGEITVISEPGVGSTFTARLPVIIPGYDVSVKNSQDSDHQLAAAVMMDTSGHAVNMILVIDDDPSVHRLMRGLLEKENFRVVSALDGRHGIELAREIVPRAIILDILMPTMDGWSVLTEVKADPKLADVPVIIASIVDEKNLGFALGASEYLTKPFERDRLLTILRRYQCDLHSCHVLILEDDVDARDLLDRLLTTAGCVTTTAGNGVVGLEKMEHEAFDLILLDLMMPEMDGLEFLERLRLHERWSQIPVVVITAKELSDDERERLTGSVQRVLYKGNYTRDELLQLICNSMSALGPAKGR